MYFFLSLIPILIFFLLIGHFRKKKIIQKVRCMSTEEKCSLFEGIIRPFGFQYRLEDDLFSTHIDAPQREFGYATLYDKSAPHVHLIFDSLPVYFNYRNRTWLLEFWKGQYGITTGAEIGLYYTNRILEPTEYKRTFFRAAEDADMLKMSLILHRGEDCLAQISQKHWWLTAFSMGCFSRPGDLCLEASLTFPTCEMANAFTEGLQQSGYLPTKVCRNCNTVSFTFDQSPRIYGLFRRMRIRLTQLSNRFWCKMYLLVTRPFTLSMDRLLYLYFYLPFAFRKSLGISNRQRRNWKRARKYV